MTGCLRWIVYGVIYSVLPIFIAWIFIPVDESIDELLGHGELAVLSVALAGGSLGALWDSTKKKGLTEILVTLNGAVFVAGLILLIIVVKETDRVTPHMALELSFWLLVLTILVGLVCNWKACGNRKANQ